MNFNYFINEILQMNEPLMDAFVPPTTPRTRHLDAMPGMPATNDKFFTMGSCSGSSCNIPSGIGTFGMNCTSGTCFWKSDNQMFTCTGLNCAMPVTGQLIMNCIDSTCSWNSADGRGGNFTGTIFPSLGASSRTSPAEIPSTDTPFGSITFGSCSGATCNVPSGTTSFSMNCTGGTCTWKSGDQTGTCSGSACGMPIAITMYMTCAGYSCSWTTSDGQAGNFGPSMTGASSAASPFGSMSFGSCSGANCNFPSGMGSFFMKCTEGTCSWTYSDGTRGSCNGASCYFPIADQITLNCTSYSCTWWSSNGRAGSFSGSSGGGSSGVSPFGGMTFGSCTGPSCNVPSGIGHFAMTCAAGTCTWKYNNGQTSSCSGSSCAMPINDQVSINCTDTSCSWSSKDGRIGQFGASNIPSSMNWFLGSAKFGSCSGPTCNIPSGTGNFSMNCDNGVCTWKSTSGQMGSCASSACSSPVSGQFTINCVDQSCSWTSKSGASAGSCSGSSCGRSDASAPGSPGEPSVSTDTPEETESTDEPDGGDNTDTIDLHPETYATGI